MDRKIESAGKRAAVALEGELDFQINNARALVDVRVLEDLLVYVKALENPEKVTKDVYLRGEWWVTVLKVDLTEDQVRLLDELGDRSKNTEATIEVQEHNPDYPLPNWRGHTRK